jgi:transcriptional regulator with XRE-family HTH domain
MPGADERASTAFKRSRRFLQEKKALGLRVRALRQQRGWTLEYAAEQMQLELSHLQRVEAASLNVTFVTLVRIAQGLDLPVAALFSEETARRAGK